MTDNFTHYSVADIEAVAQAFKRNAERYEQLFENLAREMHHIVNSAETPLRGLSACYQLAERALGDYQAYFPSNRQLACEKGCNTCCSLPVEAPEQVVADIADFIARTFNEADKVQLLERIAKHQNLIATAATPCPLLGEGGLCTVYSRRPPVCRMFSSPDERLCQSSVAKGDMVPQEPLSYRVYQALSTALVLSGQAEKAVPFVPALQRALSEEAV